MKILICLQHFLPDFVAGTEIYTFQLALHLKAFGVEPVIVIPHFGEHFSDEYSHGDIRVIRYAENSVEDRKMIMGQTRPLGLQSFAAVLLKEEPDILHFHELTPGRGFSIFHVEKARELAIPVVLTFHVSDYTCIRGSLIYKDIKKCDGVIQAKRCTTCFYQARGVTGIRAMLLANTALALHNADINTGKFNSTLGTALGFPFVIDRLKKEIIQLASMSEKIIVVAEWYKNILVQNGVPASKLLFIRQGLAGRLPQSTFRRKPDLPLKIVFVGRISPLKGVHLLVDAVCRLPADKIDLYIYGHETANGYLLKCKELAGGRSNIHWMGVIASGSSVEVLSGYDVLCLPSTFSEMSPLVIQEAFAAGLPVLASDVYGNAEQVEDGINGWLFRFKDAGDLADKLTHLVNDPSLVEAAGRKLRKPDNFSNVVAEHARLYAGILAHKN